MCLCSVRMAATRLPPGRLAPLQPCKTRVHSSRPILIRCHRGALGDLQNAGHPHSQTRLHTITHAKENRNTHTRTHGDARTLVPGRNSAALWSREGSATPQRLCDSPPITQSHPHLISPVNERLSVSRAAIGRWAPSVTVSGKCRSMGSVENGILPI